MEKQIFALRATPKGRTYLLMGALIFFLIGSLLVWNAAQAAPHPIEDQNWGSKIEAWVWQTAQGGQTEFLVFLNEQADLSGSEGLTSKAEKGWYVYRQLTAIAERSQAPLLEQLRQRGVQHRSFWVANMIWVRGDLNDVIALSRRKDVARIVANPSVSLKLPPTVEELYPQSGDGVEWNIQQVKADDVWALGYLGQAAVIGGQDTGYDWKHPALKNAYRGWDGRQANHDYNWHDAIHASLSSLTPSESTSSPPVGEGPGVRADSPLPVGEGPGVRALSCPYNSPEPCDDDGHGTHTMGTMVGLDGSNQIGMAPQARWIGCRNMDHGIGTPATYAECFQWFIAPTRLDGSDPNPALAPDVINNSWSCPPSEGCTDPNVLKSVVEAVRAAGILSVQSAGNSGSGCASVKDPATIYAASLSVGATDSSDTIASFSSRGPVTVDGSNRLKPNVVAPGVLVRSSIPSGYGYKIGTSMAAPHVAGLAALIISARPYLKGQADVIENIILSTARPLTTTETCGGIPGWQVPNNTYGWGRIDAWAAIQQALTYPLYTTYFPFIGASR